MKSPEHRQIWRCFSFLFCLLILTSTAHTERSLAAPQHTIFRSQNLKLLPLYIEKRKICVGQKEKFAVLVVNDYSANVVGASVHAKDKVFVTGADGIARWSAIAENPGQTTITIYATKAGYTQSNSYTVTLDVIDCTWNLRMDYNEAYMDTANTWVFQGSVEIEDTPFTVIDDGSLSLLTGQSSIQAQYRGTLYDTFRPMSCSPQPTLEGPYEIQFNGKYDNGSLRINLSAVAVDLPKMVTIQCIAADPNYTITPFDYPTGQRIDLINQAGLKEISCSGEFCVKQFKLSRMQMWPFPATIYASGVLIIERNKP